ncbi:hypothetical protein BD413DRAFT_613402 [Trametes elegans]|nr:hypothetical protein BD413DRAFT_613402 [Trametes elegans]
MPGATPPSPKMPGDHMVDIELGPVASLPPRVQQAAPKPRTDCGNKMFHLFASSLLSVLVTFSFGCIYTYLGRSIYKHFGEDSAHVEVIHRAGVLSVFLGALVLGAAVPIVLFFPWVIVDAAHVSPTPPSAPSPTQSQEWVREKIRERRERVRCRFYATVVVLCLLVALVAQLLGAVMRAQQLGIGPQDRLQLLRIAGAGMATVVAVILFLFLAQGSYGGASC